MRGIRNPSRDGLLPRTGEPVNSLLVMRTKLRDGSMHRKEVNHMNES